MRTTEVELRAFPYPYRAMLAVCSDLDETPDARTYLEIMRFLNTREKTTMGPGVDLEVANSIYFDMPSDQFSYWNTNDAGREMVHTLIRSGHIDCLHSYGDLAESRRHAGAAIDALARHDCRLPVWVDHAIAPSNFGADIMRGRGDLPHADVYHADLTCGQGVRYVWRGRVTSIIGQDRPRSLRRLFNATHPIRSTRTIAKESIKGALARFGNEKYAMHASNDLLRATTLRDGQRVIEFLRSNPYWGGVENADTAAGIPDILTKSMLDRLIQRGGTCVFYTHLGKKLPAGAPFDERVITTFRRIAEYQHSGTLLVCSTRRLLDFRLLLRLITVRVEDSADGIRIELQRAPAFHGVPVRPPIDGLTIYVSARRVVEIRLEGEQLTGWVRNPADHTMRESVSIPWQRLEFPDL